MNRKASRFVVVSFAAAIGALTLSAQFFNPNLPSYDDCVRILGAPSFQEILQSAEAMWDRSQLPAGRRGLQPSGYLSDGRPVFDGMPSYVDVPGAFVARVSKPAATMPRYGIPFPSVTIVLEVPGKGRRRDALRRKLEKAWRRWEEEAEQMSVAARARYYASGDAYADSVEAEKSEAEGRRKGQMIRDAEHQRQQDLKDKLFYHMNDNQLKHYRDGWKPFVQPIGGLQYGTPELMVAPNGHDVYWVP